MTAVVPRDLPTPIRVLLVDDHPIVLDGLRHLFQSQRDWALIGAYSSANAALAALRTTFVDVLVLDLRMPGKTGIDMLRSVAIEGIRCRSVLFTAALRDDDIVEAVRLGTAGIVLKESPPDALLECVRHVHAGGQWIDRDTLSRAFGRLLHRETATQEAAKTLTPREIDVVHMVARGLRNRVVGERLGISEGTVKIHLHSIYEKLGMESRVELVLHAQRTGLV